MNEKKVSNSSIYEKIENKGALDALEIYHIGQEKASAIEESILNSAKLEINQIINKSLERSADKLKTKTTEMEQLAKQKTLSTKKELIDRAFDLAHKQLLELDEKQMFLLTVKLIQQESINGDEVLKVSESDHLKYLKIFSSGKETKDEYLLDVLNKELNNKKYVLKLSKEYIDIDGGFIIAGKNFDIDLSYRSLLSHMKEKLETTIANMLFEQGV